MSREKGNAAESLTCKHLESLGYEIVERNYYSRFGEIDIIAKHKEVYHFIEVKSGLDYERAIQNITPKKLRRFINTVDVYIKAHGLTCNYQIDAAIVYDGVCELVESITL